MELVPRDLIGAAGLDFLGHGNSPGVRSYVPEFDDFVDDVVQFSLSVATAYAQRLSELRAELRTRISAAERAIADTVGSVNDTTSPLVVSEARNVVRADTRAFNA